MAPYDIRVFGDPVLVTPAREVTEIDGDLVRLANDMLETMYEAPGVGLAAPQIGVQKRMFVYDIGEGPGAIVNPRIVERDGTWEYEEGCLSVPGMSWPIVRSARVHLTGWDLDGNELSIEADELMARMLQHETDHLDGILLLERLDKGQRKGALKALRNRALGLSLEPGLRGPNAEPGLRGPNAAGLRGPNAESGLRGPNAAGLRGPNAAAGRD